jgi:ribosomal protein L27
MHSASVSAEAQVLNNQGDGQSYRESWGKKLKGIQIFISILPASVGDIALPQRGTTGLETGLGKQKIIFQNLKSQVTCPTKCLMYPKISYSLQNRFAQFIIQTVTYLC